jgi:hypothetical protein
LLNSQNSASFDLLDKKRVGFQMSVFRKPHQIKNTTAWVLMISAIAIHVFDEAVTDFLSFYNPLALDLRESFGFSFPPMFTFEMWLGGLIVGILVCFALTPIVKRGGRITRVFTIVLGILMIVNSLGHMLGSAYSGSLEFTRTHARLCIFRKPSSRLLELTAIAPDSLACCRSRFPRCMEIGQSHVGQESETLGLHDYST